MIAHAWQDLEREYMPQTSSRIRLSMKSFADYCLKSDEPPAHLFERMERVAAESRRLDAGFPPKIVVNQAIGALPEHYDVLKQIFGRLDFNKTEILSATMDRFKDINEKIKDPAEVERTNGGGRSKSKEGGIRCFLRHRMSHFV